ncbi:MAG: hypothetical protein CML68_10760 [Rhodobacteraceae bacterium]|nr:hypothetical protein [Paracoccaceae bacterium]
MSRILLSALFLLIGCAVGFFGSNVVTGAALGVGIATGASAGICMTIGAADAEGLLTPEEIDQVMTRAAADMAGLTGDAPSSALVGAREDCAKVMDQLRSQGDA